MKRFDIITEAEARVLEQGSTIVLAAGGHITPLALDTLRERRITVTRDGVDADAASLAPVASIRIVAVGGDHTSLALKADMLKHLRSRGLTAEDLGTHTKDAVDYPDTAARVARSVARGEAHAGIVIDGSGIGSVTVYTLHQPDPPTDHSYEPWWFARARGAQQCPRYRTADDRRQLGGPAGKG